MRIGVAGPQRRVCAIEGEQVIDLNLAYEAYLRDRKGASRPVEIAAGTVPADLQVFIEMGRRALDGAYEALEYVREFGWTDLESQRDEVIVSLISETRLQAPIPSQGSRIFMPIGNFGDHVRNAQFHKLGRDRSVEEVVADIRKNGPQHFVQDAANVIASGDPMIYPSRTSRLDYEAEVVVVLGKRSHDIKASLFGGFIWGFALQNDWSIRDYYPHAIGPNFGYTKNFDGSSTLGPWFVVDEIKEPQDISFATHINGMKRQDGNTREMIFSFAEYAEYVSRDMTLRAGDMISSGTTAGTATDMSPLGEGDLQIPDLFLQPGDHVEISSPNIGDIQNIVQGKRSSDPEGSLQRKNPRQVQR